MSREEAVDLYLQGRIDRRMFVRLLVAAGVTVASASAYAKVLTPERAGATAPTPTSSLYPPESLNFVRQWGSEGGGKRRFQDPQGIAVDPRNGTVYVTDNNHWVRKFDKNGKFLRRWGGNGTGNNKFDFPLGVAVDPRNGDVVVADSGNNRVMKFDGKGDFIRKWGTFGAATGEFDGPFGVAIDDSGRVYVVDQYNARVQQFKPNGDFLAAFPGGFGGLSSPTGIAIENSGFIVCDSGNSRLHRFNSAGSPTEVTFFNSGAGVLDFPRGIAVDRSNGSVYIADSNTSLVKKLDPGLVFVDRTSSSGSGPGAFNGPTGIAVRGDRVYVTDRGNHRVQQLDA